RRTTGHPVWGVDRHELRRIPEGHVKAIAPIPPDLEDRLDVLGIPFPRAFAQLVVTPPCFQDVGDPVLLEVGVEILGSELDLARLGRDADHIGSGGTGWKTEQAREIRSTAPGRPPPE